MFLDDILWFKNCSLMLSTTSTRSLLFNTNWVSRRFSISPKMLFVTNVSAKAEKLPRSSLWSRENFVIILRSKLFDVLVRANTEMKGNPNGKRQKIVFDSREKHQNDRFEPTWPLALPTQVLWCTILFASGCWNVLHNSAESNRMEKLEKQNIFGWNALHFNIQ